jgi:hypothetical protein
MYPVARFHSYAEPAARAAGVVALLAGGGLLLRTRVTLHPRGGSGEPTDGGMIPFVEPAETALSPLDWSRLVAMDDAASAPGGAGGGRIRLSGTFLEYGADAPARRRAVLLDLTTGMEAILGEGESAGGTDVLRVFQDRVLLRADGKEMELRMAFAGATGGAGDGSGGTGNAEDDGPGPLQGADRFGGKRLGETRWAFGREQLMAYYGELMNDPRRLVKVFDSMEPLYNETGGIEGYRLRILGEPDFFDAVGLREGDVVKRVNSVDMTNRRRGEFFIEQFVKGQSTAFVLDVERDGAERKQIYEVQ